MSRVEGLPWEISFSYGRALLGLSLETWRGEQSNLAGGSGRPPTPGAPHGRRAPGRVLRGDGAGARSGRGGLLRPGGRGRSQATAPLIDVAFTPSETRRAEVAVVVDVLRAGSTIVSALEGGFRRVLCCDTVERVECL